ncbi:DNA mismatch repair protein MutL [Alphaproteobacteria bacterium]
MKIRVLSERAINKIAAGEVIERPLSVVKELVENAIDADACDIQVKLIKGGRTLVSVQDNGVGISYDDLPLTVHRHATSKLLGENLDDIHYLGFRGEALASIAAVAKLKIISRVENSEHAWEMSVNDPISMPETRYSTVLVPASHSVGTTIEVCDLFCFTPNRLRFLRSENYENSVCIDLMQRIALAFPDVGFKLINNGKVIFDYQKVKKDANAIRAFKGSLRHRTKEILGSEFMENAIYIEEAASGVKVYGYAAVPTYNRSKNNNMFCFVNKRMIKDTFLNSTIRAAYLNVLPGGYYPAVVLFVDVDAMLVDVNVHPTKIQVRFSDEKAVGEIVIRAIKDAISKATVSTKFGAQFLGKVKESVSNDMIKERLQDRQHLLNITGSTKLAEKSVSSFKNHQNLLSDEQSSVEGNNDLEDARQQQNFHHHPINFTNIKNGDSSQICPESLGKAVCQIGLRYIIAETEDAIIILDQHAAHERLVLQKMKASIMDKNVVKQTLLLPEIIMLSIAEVESLLVIQCELAKLGLCIGKGENREIVVHSVPAILGNLDLKGLFTNILANLEIYQHITADKIDKICSEVACHSSIRGKRKLSLMEMDSLLREVEDTEFSSQCNHGRPTYIRIPLTYMDKLFERS